MPHATPEGISRRSIKLFAIAIGFLGLAIGVILLTNERDALPLVTDALPLFLLGALALVSSRVVRGRARGISVSVLSLLGLVASLLIGLRMLLSLGFCGGEDLLCLAPASVLFACVLSAAAFVTALRSDSL